MAITFNCTCGQQLQVDDEFAGAQAQCPDCNKVLTVPSPSAPVAPPVAKRPTKRSEPVETDDDLGAEADSLDPFAARRKSKRRRDDDGDPRDQDEDERPSKRTKRLVDDDEDDYRDRPRKKRRMPKQPPPYKALNNQTVGGIICLFLSLVLFGIGLYFDLFFVRWILVLGIVGLIGVVHGLVPSTSE
jgi:hypothetical protein